MKRGRKHARAKRPARVMCPRCGDTKIQHHVCPTCHYYRGRRVEPAHRRMRQ